MCGCVDYSLYGSAGMFWGCMHSQCQCPSGDSNVKENDKCGIHASDFQNPSFVGKHPVSGEGCILGSRSSCLCKPVLGNGVLIEDWTWQCSDDSSPKKYQVGMIIAISIASVFAGALITCGTLFFRICHTDKEKKTKESCVI